MNPNEQYSEQSGISAARYGLMHDLKISFPYAASTVPFRFGGVVLKRKFTLSHTSFDKERVTKYADNHCNF